MNTHHSNHSSHLALGALVLAVSLGMSTSLSAQVVANTADAGAGSLREAIADATSGGTITFAANLSGQTITLTSGQLLVNKDLNIDASTLAGGITIDGNNTSRIFEFGAGTTSVISTLTITNGNQLGAGGGGILNLGTLAINDSTLAGNSADQGGAIYGISSSLSLSGCTLHNNVATLEGGAVRSITSAFSATNCTFTANTSQIAGACSLADNGPPAQLSHVTVSGNTATHATLGGGGLFFYSQTGTLVNCLVAGNTAPTNAGPDLYIKPGSPAPTSGGGNLVGDNATAISQFPVGIPNGNNDWVGTSAVPLNPLLAPLGDYGGSTLTIPPLPGSPAIDAGFDTGSLPATDQRGLARLSGIAIDIGAVELHKPVNVGPPGECRGTVLFAEDFDAIPLLSSFDETPVTPNVWARIPPSDWAFDHSGVPGHASLANDGVSEWAGWAFADLAWWSQLTPPDLRGLFTNASDTVLVADGERWNGLSHSPGLMTTLMSTPPISLKGMGRDSLSICFDSSWRPGGQQKAIILASYDGAPSVEVMRWESDPFSDYCRLDAPNERVHVSADNPAGAAEVVFTFAYEDAGDDHWWAIDNVEVSADPKAVVITHIRPFPGSPAQVEIKFEDTLPPTLPPLGNPGGLYYVNSRTSLVAGVWQQVGSATLTPPNLSGLYTALLPAPTETTFYSIQYHEGALDDLDGDGVEDSFETNGWDVTIFLVGGGTSTKHVTSDPGLYDTDNDGISDYDEMVTFFSDPGDADTDGDGLSDFEEVFVYFSDHRHRDTDLDGFLTDGAEVRVYHTSPVLTDTDGDNLPDRSEQTDTPSNPDLTRPLVSDLPTPLIKLIPNSTTIELDITYADSMGVETSYSTTIGESQSTALGRSDSRTMETAVETSASITVGAEVEAGFPPSATVSTEATVGVASTVAQGRTSTTDTTQTMEVNNQYSTYRGDSSSRTISTGHGKISVLFEVKNNGPRAFTISNIEILARLRDASRTVVGTLQPVGSMINLSPGTTSASLQASLDNIFYPTMEKIFANPALLTFEVANLDVTNAEGVNNVFLEEINLTRTAGLVIDYGSGTNSFGTNLPPESYRVATETEQGQGGVTISKVLSQHFPTPIPYQVATQTGTGHRVLTEVRGVAVDAGHRAFWVVATSDIDGPTHDFDNIPLTAGDEIQLFYVQDRDHDGLNDREEFINGSDDMIFDTDGDGISDYDEVKIGRIINVTLRSGVVQNYSVHSDPRFQDLDGDGLNDPAELNLGTDPRLADTDGDGTTDDADPTPLFYDALDLSACGPLVTVSNSAVGVVALASVTIDWGDSSTTVLSVPTNTHVFPYSTNHLYANGGQYAVTATVRDINNQTYAVTASHTVASPTVPTREDLLGEYLFSDAASTNIFSDTSDNGRHLSSAGSSCTCYTATTDPEGNANHALFFDNGDVIDGQYVRLQTVTSGWGYGAANAGYTISSWIRPENSSWGVIAGQINSPVLQKNRDKLLFGDPDDAPLIQSSMPPLPQNGTWVHVAVTASARSGNPAGRTFTLYQNGRQMAQVFRVDSQFTYPALAQGYVGGWHNTSQPNRDEDYVLVETGVDSVRVFNRELDGCEISTIASSGVQ